MKKKIILGTLLFIGVFITLLVNRIHSKKHAIDHIVSKTQFDDTLIRYTLFSDSLVLTFPKKIKQDYWLGEVFIWKTSPRTGINIQFPGRSEGKLGKLPYYDLNWSSKPIKTSNFTYYQSRKKLFNTTYQH